MHCLLQDHFRITSGLGLRITHIVSVDNIISPACHACIELYKFVYIFMFCSADCSRFDIISLDNNKIGISISNVKVWKQFYSYFSDIQGLRGLLYLIQLSFFVKCLIIFSTLSYRLYMLMVCALLSTTLITDHTLLQILYCNLIKLWHDPYQGWWDSSKWKIENNDNFTYAMGLLPNM